jgi:RimJ/RimL family protein N-acetyltransferase
MSGAPVPAFDTGRLHLRRLAPDDAPALHQAYGDADSMRFWDAPPCRTLAETQAQIAHSLSAPPAAHAAWAVLAGPGRDFVGMVNYHARWPAARRLAVGWILLPRHVGHGYMLEAMHALLAHCFATLDTHRVEAEIEPANTRSVRLAERLGFRHEGVLRDRFWVAGEPRTIAMYGLLRPEWHAVSGGIKA